MVDLKVKEIMIQDVMSTDFYDKIIDVADFMYKKGIGSIIVNKNGVPEGIVTERDIVHNCVMGPQTVFNSTVGGIMSEPIICVNEDSSVIEACRLMRDCRIKKLVVMGNDKIVGVVTMTDIVNSFDMLFYSPKETIDMSLRDLMIKSICIVDHDVIVSDVAKVMKSRSIGSVLVAKDNIPQGIITERDVVRSVVIGSPNFYKLKARDIMSKHLITLREEQMIMDSAHLMRDRHIKKIVIVNKDNKISGIVTQTDLTYNIDVFYSVFREVAR